MATTKVVYEIEVNGSKQAVSNIKELKDAKKELQKVIENSQIGSDQYQRAQKELEALNKELKDLTKTEVQREKERERQVDKEVNALRRLQKELKAAKADALNGDSAAAKKVAELTDKIDDLRDATKTLQGSGVEKVSNSFRLLTDGLQNFDGDKVATAFKGIGAAMKAVPIFLLIEGINLLIGSFGEIVEFFRKLTGGFTEQEREMNKLKKAYEEQIEVNKAYIKQKEREIAVLQTQKGTQLEILALEKQINERRLQDAQASIKIKTKEIAQIEQSVTWYENLSRAIFGAGIARDIADSRRSEELAAKNKELNEQVESARDAINANIINAAKTEQQIEAERKAARDLRNQNISDERKKEIAQLQATYVDQQKELKGNNEALLQLHIKYREDLKAINIKYDEIERINRAEFDKQRLELQKKATQDLIKQLSELNKQHQKEESDREIINTYDTEQAMTHIKQREREKDREEFFKDLEEKYNISKSYSDALQTLSDTVFSIRQANAIKGSKEEEKLARQQFKINKALQIANATIGGAQAIITTLAKYGPPPNPISIAAIIATVATTAASIAKISATQFDNKGYASYDDGSAYKVATPAANSSINTDAPEMGRPLPGTSFTNLNDQGNVIAKSQPIKAYVVESEMTEKQKRVRRLEEQASF